MTNFIQILFWILHRPDIILVWASICKWCNDNFIEDHNACIANSLATKMRLTFQYVQFVVMLLATKRTFNKSFQDLLGTGSTDVANDSSSFCKKKSKSTSSSTTSKPHKAEAALDSEKYTSGGSYEKEASKAGAWIVSQFRLWKCFFDMAKEKDDTSSFADVPEIFMEYLPEEIGRQLIPCYIRNFIIYRAEVITDNTKTTAEATECPCEYWIQKQKRGTVLNPLYAYLLKYA